MTLLQIGGLAIEASIFLVVFAIGLNATMREVVCLFRHPGLLVRSILSVNVVMLVFAIAGVLLFNLDPAIDTTLVALAAAPVPLVLPNGQAKASGSQDYAGGLLATAALAAIVLVPVTIAVVGHLAGRNLYVPTGKVVSTVLISVLVPLMAGALVRRSFPACAGRSARAISRAAMILLLLAVLPILVVASKAIWVLLGNGTLVCVAGVTLTGLIAGHLLGGPDRDHRTVLALATALRHPGVALAVASINFPDQESVAAVIICYLVVAASIATAYLKWRTRAYAPFRLA